MLKAASAACQRASGEGEGEGEGAMVAWGKTGWEQT